MPGEHRTRSELILWCASVALLAACRDEKAPEHAPPAQVKVRTTEVVCQFTFEAYTESGTPDACRGALDKFLADHPTDGILSVIPIEAPPAEKVAQHHNAAGGTQRLLVVHHEGAGPGIRADTLEVNGIVCTDGSLGLPMGPAYCQQVVNEFYNYSMSPTALWVPLTKDANADRGEVRGTHKILRLTPRAVSPPAASR